MPKATTRKIVAAPAAKPVAAKPVKPISAKASAAISAATPGNTTVITTAPAVAKPSGNITRTAATVVKQATNFAVLSDRDSAYLAFYATLAKRANNGAVTLAAIVATGERPTHAGSNKPHDAGVINRLTKAGLLQPATDGHSFAFTTTGKTHGAYTSAKA